MFNSFPDLLLKASIWIGIFFAARELMSWYWKINQIVRNQNEIKDLLKELIDTTRNSTSDNAQDEESEITIEDQHLTHDDQLE